MTRVRGVYASAELCSRLGHVIRLGIAAQRSNGVYASPEVRAFADAVDAEGRQWVAETSGLPLADSANGPNAEAGAFSPHGVDGRAEWPARRVARLLDLTDRRVRTLAATGVLPARRSVSGHREWLFDEADVRAYAETRSNRP